MGKRKMLAVSMEATRSAREDGKQKRASSSLGRIPRFPHAGLVYLTRVRRAQKNDALRF